MPQAVRMQSLTLPVLLTATPANGVISQTIYARLIILATVPQITLI
jgi:hypothetical protein